MPKLRVAKASFSDAPAATRKLRIAKVSFSGTVPGAPKLRISAASFSGTLASAPKLRVSRASFSGPVAPDIASIAVLAQYPKSKLDALEHLIINCSTADTTGTVVGFECLVTSNTTTSSTVEIVPFDVDTFIVRAPATLRGGVVTVTVKALDGSGNKSAGLAIPLTVARALSAIMIGGVLVPKVDAFWKGT